MFNIKQSEEGKKEGEERDENQAQENPFLAKLSSKTLYVHSL